MQSQYNHLDLVKSETKKKKNFREINIFNDLQQQFCISKDILFIYFLITLVYSRSLKNGPVHIMNTQTTYFRKKYPKFRFFTIPYCIK